MAVVTILDCIEMANWIKTVGLKSPLLLSPKIWLQSVEQLERDMTLSNFEMAAVAI
jgi:hypothetical protein